MWGKQQQSQYFMDMLLHILPSLKGRDPQMLQEAKKRMKTSAENARKLMDIWENEDSKIASTKFRRPSSISSKDVTSLETEGLVTAKGEQIEITQKGAHVIKQMILGDDRSIFEEVKTAGKMDYVTACANLKSSRKLRKYASRVESSSNSWYQAYKDSVNG